VQALKTESAGISPLVADQGIGETGGGGADKPIKILFSTGSITHLPIEDVFTLARDAGFDGCDLVVGKSFNRPDYRERIRECSRILPVYSMHAPFVHIAAFGNEVEALGRSVELAHEYGTKVITFHPPSWLAREFRFLRWFRKVRDFQKELGCENVRLAIENMPLLRLVLPSYVLNNFQKLIKFGMERNLFFTYDVTHIGTYGYDIVDAFLLYIETGRLQNIHLSDYSLWREKSHLGIGRGELPIVRLLNTMTRMGYRSFVTLELAPQELPRTKEWLLKVLTYVCSYLELQLGQREISGSRG
jgi:sugar phosphate isomerase/epimerase